MAAWICQKCADEGPCMLVTVDGTVPPRPVCPYDPEREAKWEVA